MRSLKSRLLMLLLISFFLVASTAAFSVGSREEMREKTYTIRLGHIFTTEHPTHMSTVAMADYVKAKSNGRLTVEVYPSAQLGKGNVQVENIATGTTDLGTAGPGMISRIEAAFGLLAGEYVFKSVDSMFALLDGPVGQEINQRLLDQKGVRILTVAFVGKRHITANKPIRTPAGLKGLKVRIPNIPTRAAAFRAWGASPTPMAFAEVYLALKQGVVDAQENPFAQIVTMKFNEVQKYLMLTGHAMNTELLLINEDVYQTLPDDLQKILNEGAEVYTKKQWELYKQLRDKYLKQLKDSGMTVIEPDNKAFAEAVKDVPFDFEDRWGKGLYAKVLKAQEGYKADWE